MKQVWIVIALMLIAGRVNSQSVYVSPNAGVTFFSATPIEDIDAYTTQAVAAMDATGKTVYFKVPIKTFTFKKALMQKHFNENYLESDKYPNATFSGTIVTPVDLSKEGTYDVEVDGKFNVHGVEVQRKFTGKITVKDQTISIISEFEVKPADHDIKIPAVVRGNIAEIIDVKVNASLSPKAN